MVRRTCGPACLLGLLFFWGGGRCTQPPALYSYSARRGSHFPVSSSCSCIGLGNAVLAPARHLTNWLVGKWPKASFKVKRQGRVPLEEGATQLFDKCVQLVRASLRPAPH